MGRELRRKQAKREGKNVREVQKNSKEKPLSTKTFVIIIITMLLFGVILYILSGIFITKEIKWFSKDDTDKEDSSGMVENRILASETLKQMDLTYYVYYYDPDDEDSEVSNVIYGLTEMVYRVDLSDDFNSNYIGEASGIVTDIHDLRVTNPTIIKVEDDKMTEFYSGKDQIVSALDVDRD